MSGGKEWHSNMSGQFIGKLTYLFVEAILPGNVLRTLDPEELDAYRAPYVAGGEDRRPLLTWPREVPFDGEPADTHQIMSTYSEWLKSSTVPKTGRSRNSWP